MNARTRVITALQHQEPDRVPVDLGAMMSTGIMGIAYNELKTHLGIHGGRTRMYDLGQQLAEPEPEVLQRIGADVLPLLISEPKAWKPSTLPDGSPCEVPTWFTPERQPDGSQVLRDAEGHVVSRMPPGGYYFDGVYHPLADVQSIHELEQYPFYTPIDQATLDDLHARAKHLYETTEYALMLNGAGSLYEWAQTLRGWDVFMMDLAGDPAFAGALLAKLADAHIRRMEQVLPAVEGYIQAIQVGDDLGMQSGPQISPRLYRKVVKPWHKELYQYIHQHTDAKLFLHTCGSVYAFIPDLIEIGVDILNPVQVSAKDMDTRQLKREFGKDITFWGGGCDTQHVLPFGTPAEVKDEVKRRIDDLAPGGGFVFTQVHNIQAGVPVENIVAMYEAVQEFGHY